MRIKIINVKGSSRNSILTDIASAAVSYKLASNKVKLLDAFLAREAEGTTAFENGLAIPHARISEIKEAAIIIARADKAVEWQALDGNKTKCAIALLIPGGNQAGDLHLKYLAALARLLLDRSNVEVFKTGTAQKIKTLLDATLKEEQQEISAGAASSKDESESQQTDRLDFVAVTSCPTGVAHTNMSAEALERFAKENGLKVKVERQAAQGTVNQITSADMDKTDNVILAIGREIEGRERFAGKHVLEVGVAAPLKDAADLWKRVRDAPVTAGPGPGNNKPGESPTVFGGYSNTSAGFPANKEKIHLMRAVMTGLSYMIPVVIVGGIFLAFGLGIGRIALGDSVDKYPGSAWYTIFQIGVAGIQLSVVVLGGFIAQAIGGRLALAPAMIIAFIAQGIGFGTSNWAFFDYVKLSFGVDNSNLSFYGAIAAAFLIGFAARYWNRYVSPHIPKVIKTIEPIIIVPLLFVLVGWVLFAFALYVPLYWLSVGMDKGVRGLIDYNLLWIAGAIGGAMLCFDLGGPVNKIAFGTGVALIAQKQYALMGAIAAAGTVAPIGMAIGWLLGSKVFKIKNLVGDQMAKESFVPAMFMGLLGIAEGAIPYTLRNPRSAIISNVVGGAVAGAISGAFLITDTAAHTGPIVYILGAIGREGNTDYLWGLLYIMAWAAGAIVTAALFIILELIFQKTGRGTTQTAEREDLKKRGLWPRIKGWGVAKANA